MFSTEKISKDTILNMVKGQAVNGVVLVKDYQTRPTKTGGTYISGVVQLGVSVPFRVWSNSVAYNKLTQSDFKGKVCSINAEYDDFGGNASFIVSDIQVMEGYDESEFFDVIYNKEAYEDSLKSMCEKNLTPNGMQLVNKLLFENKDVWGRFTVEFAGASHHDNCLNGLLAHTVKAVSILLYLLKIYPALYKNDDTIKDLLIIGTVIHDIGKVQEMHNGVYQDTSFVTHRILGLDYLFENKDLIVNTYDEKWFRYLQSILVGHHNEYGDACRTVVAYVVHLVDNLESNLTLLSQDMQKATSDTIKVQDLFLKF